MEKSMTGKLWCSKKMDFMKYLKKTISIFILFTISITPLFAQPDPEFCECPEGFIPSGECENDCDQDPDLCCIENTIPLQRSEANAALIAAGFFLVLATYYKQKNKSKNLPLLGTAQGSSLQKLSKQTKHFFQGLF